ncbi:hypothetical protein GGS23DRAFT_512546 [Durotheca rogersii]|uniref:uncharacterized protein n=1 Tax=Durotheca rogersii TaxID=419775 RepID=UPI00221EB4AB|nr:uncharacterized protein GGS23DRAFT_512546 [Durotheca rogersii]KAI5863749.1 hypothetical protein GGS23DRAFT_512546 [Durotheca rogersii]
MLNVSGLGAIRLLYYRPQRASAVKLDAHSVPGEYPPLAPRESPGLDPRRHDKRSPDRSRGADKEMKGEGDEIKLDRVQQNARRRTRSALLAQPYDVNAPFVDNLANEPRIYKSLHRDSAGGGDTSSVPSYTATVAPPLRPSMTCPPGVFRCDQVRPRHMHERDGDATLHAARPLLFPLGAIRGGKPETIVFSLPPQLSSRCGDELLARCM